MILTIPKDVFMSEIVRVLDTKSICGLACTSRGMYACLHGIVERLHDHHCTMRELREKTKLMYYDLDINPIYECVDYEHFFTKVIHVSERDWYITRLPDNLSSQEFMSLNRSVSSCKIATIYSRGIPKRYKSVLSLPPFVSLYWVIALRE